MKKPATKQFKKELKSTIRKLQQYCHGKNCKLIEECPAKHWAHDCCGKLDLDTAIAWDTALDLKLIISLLFSLERQKKSKYIYQDIVEIIDSYSKIIKAVDIRERLCSYHISKYKKLDILLGETYWKVNNHYYRLKKFVNNTSKHWWTTE